MGNPPTPLPETSQSPPSLPNPESHKLLLEPVLLAFTGARSAGRKSGWGEGQARSGVGWDWLTRGPKIAPSPRDGELSESHQISPHGATRLSRPSPHADFIQSGSQDRRIPVKLVLQAVSRIRGSSPPLKKESGGRGSGRVLWDWTASLVLLSLPLISPSPPL